MLTRVPELKWILHKISSFLFSCLDNNNYNNLTPSKLYEKFVEIHIYIYIYILNIHNYYLHKNYSHKFVVKVYLFKVN